MAKRILTPVSVADEIRRTLKAGGSVERSTTELGRMFSQGIDVPIDREAALRWYSVAASQESIVAERKDLQEAKAYLRSAT
jgi:TPR repeat protein